LRPSRLLLFPTVTDTPATEISPLSLHDALPISRAPGTESAGALAEADAVWTIRGFAPRNRADGGASRYFAFGEGVSRGVETSGKDRKSTRLNSSHDQISYAVFCLKKKKANAVSA